MTDQTTPDAPAQQPTDSLPYSLHLIHNGQRTLIAKFASPWLATLAADLFTAIPDRPDLQRDGYAVEGIRVDGDPTPWELEAVARELLATVTLPPDATDPPLTSAVHEALERRNQ